MAECSSINYQLSGLQSICNASIGGISTLYLINEEDIKITRPEVKEDETVTGNLRIDGTQGTITYANDKKFQEYRFRNNTGSMTTTFETDETGSYKVFTTEVSLQFGGLNSGTRMQIMAMCMNSVVAVVKDAKGDYWLLGGDGKQVNASAATAVTGTDAKEFNGYTVTLKVEQDELPYEIDKAVFEALISK